MDVLSERGVEAKVQKVTDVIEIAKYGAFGTPAVIVGDEIFKEVTL
jgi:2-hydroxychromene-2-carboxylate isomerase